jgi:hypothetical protein
MKRYKSLLRVHICSFNARNPNTTNVSAGQRQSLRTQLTRAQTKHIDKQTQATPQYFCAPLWSIKPCL